MKKAVFLTAYNRLSYLQQTLWSWESVRGLEDWTFVAMVEPSPIQMQIVEELQLFVGKLDLRDYCIIVNPKQYGVQHHPWVGFERLFEDGYDFVVRAEDDLLVSDDVLEYFDYVAETFKDDPLVASAHGYSQFEEFASEMPASVVRTPYFSPLTWGTWADRWRSIIGPTWDHDYSTFNGEPGNQAGWDWNLNTRIYPAHDLYAIQPAVSRVQNIGLVGTHSTPENFRQAPTFEKEMRPQSFHLS